MKKIISYIFMIAVTAVLFTACGSKESNMSDNTTPTDATTNTSTNVTAADADATASATANNAADATSDVTADANVTADSVAQKSKSQKSDTIISEEEAKGIALKDANLADSEISRFQIKLERDDGIQKYDIDFHAGQQEYDYEIDAGFGKILEKDVEPID